MSRVPEPKKFTISSASAILTPDTPGLKPLVRSVCEGRSIRARQSADRPVASGTDQEQYLYGESSGTSGAPKRIRRRPSTWIQSFEINRERFGLNSSDTYAIFGSLGHSLSLYAVLEALHVGADLASLSGLGLRNQVRHVVSGRISVIYATPTQMRRFSIAARQLGHVHMTGVRRLFVGGGKLDCAVRQALGECFPNAEIREFYGTSETSFIALSDERTPDGSVGQPYPQVTLRIAPANQADSGPTGEIQVSSPYLFDGYESGDGQIIRTRAEHFWRVGDIGWVDEDGYLFLKGRRDRMVTVADVNVYPEEIESIISGEPGIKVCAVMPMVDDRRGHRILAILEGTPDWQQEYRIRQQCREKLHALAVPSRFEYWHHIPVLPTGKPDLQAIQKRLDTHREA